MTADFPAVEVLAPNFTRLTLPDATQVWFSYKTPVAFRPFGRPPVVRTNDWSVTTGKHLNVIDGGSPAAKAARVDEVTFARLWTECNRS